MIDGGGGDMAVALCPSGQRVLWTHLNSVIDNIHRL